MVLNSFHSISLLRDSQHLHALNQFFWNFHRWWWIINVLWLNKENGFYLFALLLTFLHILYITQHTELSHKQAKQLKKSNDRYLDTERGGLRRNKVTERKDNIEQRTTLSHGSTILQLFLSVFYPWLWNHHPLRNGKWSNDDDKVSNKLKIVLHTALLYSYTYNIILRLNKNANYCTW